MSFPSDATPSGPRVDNGDGTYYLSLPAGASTASHWDGPLFYVYDGQADFAWAAPVPYSELLDDDPVQEPDDGGLHGLVGSVSIDELGRRWVVDAVDEPALLAKVAVYDAEIGDEPTTPSGQAPAQVADAPGAVEWHPTSWNSMTCPEAEQKSFWYDTDTTFQSTSLDSRTSAIAIVYAVNDATRDEYDFARMELVPVCSGFFVDAKNVVTAAHCFYHFKDRVQMYGSGQLAVCTRGNHLPGSQCSTVRARRFDEAAIKSGPKSTARNSWDIAVLNLHDPIGGSAKMHMSQASVAWITPEVSRSWGHPAHLQLPSCASNRHAALVQVETSAGHHLNFSARYIGHTSEVIGSKNNVLRTRHTAIGGWSGGPIFYLRTGGGLTRAFATGLVAGHYNTPFIKGFTGGPLMRARRTWVLGFME